MLIDLSTYLEELKNEKLEIETSNDEKAIKEAVAQYEAKIRAEYAEARASHLKEKEIEIDVLERIVAREAKKEEEKVTVEEVGNAPTEPEVVAYAEPACVVCENVVSEENQSENNDLDDL
jgi:hypothetical protein